MYRFSREWQGFLVILAVTTTGCPDVEDDDSSTFPVESPTPVPGVPRIELDTSPMAFGQVLVETTAEGTRALSNAGTAVLTLEYRVDGVEPGDTGAFTITGPDGDSPPGMLASGESTELVVHFAPLLEIDYAANLVVMTNDESAPELSIALSGTGYEPMVDQDQDGFPAGEDCNDQDPAVYPGALEVCDGLDNDCDLDTDEDVLGTFFFDGDGDGYGDPAAPAAACDPPPGHVVESADCDDTDPGIHPGAEEACDGVDNDCDGVTYEDVQATFYQDGDGDGFGLTTASTLACSAPDGFAASPDDCDDTDAGVYPGAIEACDGVDNDCDGSVDEEGVTPFYPDGDGDGHGASGSGLVGCNAPDGYVASSDDCDDGDPAIYPGAEERCNGIDDDCDCPPGDGTCVPEIDEGAMTTYYLDADQDGFGDFVPIDACEPPDPRYATSSGDCDDLDPDVHPGALETCNERDDDCDGEIDEGDIQEIFYLDADSDGFGGVSSTVSACDVPDGYAADATDCDDSREDTYPGAEEVCDGADNDCNGAVDEGVETTYYQDGDADGYGVTSATLAACDRPDGYADEGGDCDDTAASVHPGALEVCNGVDDDCDGTTDEDGTTVFYLDLDGDGHGDPLITTQACSPPSSYVDSNDDCDDRDASVYPGADELCNGVDDDCDAEVDEGEQTTYYLDADQDGFGDPDVAATGCAPPGPRFGLDAGDCNDLDPAVNPSATETCNGIDDNCDQATDEGYDDDGDATSDCVDDDGDGFTEQDGDCDDGEPAVYPGAPEVWGDGLDNDCDGLAFAERVIDFETFPDGSSVPTGAAIGDQFEPWGVYFRNDGTTTVSPTIRTNSGFGFAEPTSGVNALGSDSHNSAGLVAYFAPDLYVTEVSIRDTDDDCTWKILYAFDEFGTIIDQMRSDGACHEGGPRPTITVAPVDDQGEPLPIARVEFDTQAGPSGGSYDGTYFTIDDFTLVYGIRPADFPRTRVIDFEFTPDGIVLNEGVALISQYLGWGVQFDTDGTTSSPATIRSYNGTGFLRPSSGKNALGSDSHNSAGIVARFTDDITVTRVSLRDVDDDGTVKTLYAFDADGNVIASDESHGTSDSRAPLPLIQVAPVDADGNPLRIHAVEFDTQPGDAGGSQDGTYFTIDDLSFTYFED